MDTNQGKQKQKPKEPRRKTEVECHIDLFRCMLADRYLLPASQDNVYTLLRFLTDTIPPEEHRYNHGSAVGKWEKMIKWRIKNQVDTIIQDFVYKEHEDVRLCYPQGFHGVDKVGRPIYIQYADKIDCAKLMEVTTKERFTKFYIQECERMVAEKFPACSKIAKKAIDSVVHITVLPEGLTSHNKGFKAYMYALMLDHRLQQIRDDYYPQTVHQVFYINAGIGKKLLTGLRHGGRDRRKRPAGLYALGKNFRTKLLEFIDEDQLPTSLGGSCSCPGKEGGCLRFEKGPWEVPQPRTGLGSAVSPEKACDECNELQNDVNILSSKIEKLETTPSLLKNEQNLGELQGN